MAGDHPNYKRIYQALLVLLVVSVAGPFLEVVWVTLLTAFGIALVKAHLVIQNFMHLKWEKRLMKWMLTSSLLLMFLMVAGVAPDVMSHEGQNWENVAAKDAVERGIDGEGSVEVGEAEVEPPVDPAVFSAAQSFAVVCATCHGAGGAGDGAAGAALDPPPADFTDPAFWEGRDRDRILTVIRDGAAAVGGSLLMAPWGALYDDEQLGQMADYVMSLRPNE